MDVSGIKQFFLHVHAWEPWKSLKHLKQNFFVDFSGHTVLSDKLPTGRTATTKNISIYIVERFVWKEQQ